MKIYTYYEDIGFKNQDQLLDLWKYSWSKHGFTPIVLTRNEAKKSNLYEKYYDFVQRVHEKVSNKRLSEKEYCLAAQLEIVAFTTIDSASFISDYDVINYDFPKPETINKKLHWRNGCCSCFASGDSNSWRQYIEFLFQKENEIVQWCRKEKEKTKRKEFHDQDFLEAIHKEAKLNNIIEMSRDKKLCGKYFPNESEKQKIYHLSHNNMHEIQILDNEHKDADKEDIRIIIAKKILDM